MIGCGTIIGLVVGIVAFAFIVRATGSVVFGLMLGVPLFFMIAGVFLQAQGDVNRATQHERDREILDAIKDLKDKE